MIQFYLRSSSLDMNSFCNMQSVLVYMFGMKNGSGKSAWKGTVYHRIMQMRADRTKAVQEGKKDFEDEDFGLVTVKEVDNVDHVVKMCFDHYYQIEAVQNDNDRIKGFGKKELREITRWINHSIEDYGGAIDPYNKKIVQTEKFFDMELPYDWAHYSQKINGKLYEGQLALKGTVDLIYDMGDDVYGVDDYKSGRRLKDYDAEIEKKLKDHIESVQAKVYYYALTNEYPDKTIGEFSFYYPNSGGYYSNPTSEGMYEQAIDMMKEKFEEIKAIKNPWQVDPNHFDKMSRGRKANWKCMYCCDFSKAHPKHPEMSVCDFMKSEITKHGIDKAVEMHGDLSRIMNYGSGGGRQEQTD